MTTPKVQRYPLTLATWRTRLARPMRQSTSGGSASKTPDPRLNPRRGGVNPLPPPG